MVTNKISETYSLKVIRSIVGIQRISTPRMRKLVHDINHVISAYELNDKEVAIACNHYITWSYPTFRKVASNYGLHPMDEHEIKSRSIQELQHILYCMCIYLYDNLKTEGTACKQHIYATYKK